MITLLVILLLVGLALWALGQMPIDPAIMTLIRVIVVVVAVLYTLQFFGLLPWHMRGWR